MGRSAGWIAAGTVLARRFPADPPHIILVPEIRYDIDAILARIKECVATFGYCVIVAGEGIKDAAGKEIGADFNQLDDFGHPLLSGAAERLGQIIFGKLGTKTRTVKLGYAQRAAAHCGSATDAAEAFACGEAAVQAAVGGQSGYMVTLVRDSSNPYRWSTALRPLAEIANVEHFVPRDWISEDGFLPNEKFVEYARPLIEGETRPPAEGGLPKFVAIEKARIEKKLPPRASS
jgi:6-phosphofructokinase 1